MVFTPYVGFKCILLWNNLQCDHCFLNDWKSHSHDPQPLNICSDFCFCSHSFSIITTLLSTQNLLLDLRLWPSLYWEKEDNFTKDVKTTHRSPDYQKKKFSLLSLWFPVMCGFNSETYFDLINLSSHSWSAQGQHRYKAKYWPCSFSVLGFCLRSPCSTFTTVGFAKNCRSCCTVVPALSY